MLNHSVLHCNPAKMQPAFGSLLQVRRGAELFLLLNAQHITLTRQGGLMDGSQQRESEDMGSDLLCALGKSGHLCASVFNLPPLLCLVHFDCMLFGGRHCLFICDCIGTSAMGPPSPMEPLRTTGIQISNKRVQPVSVFLRAQPCSL